MQPYLLDTTLRDGEQAPGVVFDYSAKMSIARMLERIGVEELEIGSPFVCPQEEEVIRKLVQAGFRFRCTCWSRARFDDIDAAARTGASGINISFPVSQIQLAALDKNYNWVLSSMGPVIEYAQKRFRYVSLGAQDASRADIGFLSEFIMKAEQMNVFRIRLADTVGCLNPFSTAQLIRDAKMHIQGDMQVQFHGHNDLGMATANSISALMAGADCVDVTVNGLGERAGNAALEEVIVALQHSLHADAPYQKQLLYELCRYVAKTSGRDIADMKPITGSMAHKHESGIHTNSMLKDPRTYQLFEALEVGKPQSGFVYGLHSGSAAISHYLNKKSMYITKDEANVLMRKVKDLSFEKKRSLTSAEMDTLCEMLMKEKHSH
jgi:homocitrate synthase NifV